MQSFLYGKGRDSRFRHDDLPLGQVSFPDFSEGVSNKDKFSTLFAFSITAVLISSVRNRGEVHCQPANYSG